jgi:alcohol dehydrogenase
MLGATLAGQAFANAPVGGVHALAYPLGGRFHISHGLSNALMLPHVMRFNAAAAAPLYADLAKLIVGGAETNLSDLEQSYRLVNYLETLIEKLGLPNTLQSQNIEPQDLPDLAAAAMQQERLLQNNPREISERDALNIYQQAYGEVPKAARSL